MNHIFSLNNRINGNLANGNILDVLHNRRVQVIAAAGGAVAAAYSIYNNFDIVSSSVQSLLSRSVADHFFNISKFFWDNSGYFFIFVGMGVVIYQSALSIYQICASNNKWLVFKLLMGYGLMFDLNAVWEINKLPPNILDNIVTSNPWEAFRILSNEATRIPSLANLIRKIYLANYPYDILVTTEHLATSRVTRIKYPLLVNQDNNIINVLYYLGKFPELYVGDNKLPKETLEAILSWDDPRPVLRILCTHPHIWQGSDKLSSSDLLKLLRNPLMHEELLNWLPLFKGPYRLKSRDVRTILNYEAPFELFWRKLILNKLMNICQVKQSNSDQQKPILNIEKFFCELEMSKWDQCSPVTIQNARSDIWDVTIRNCDALDSICLSTLTIKSNLSNFCNKCVLSRDAQESQEAKNAMALRVINVIYHLIILVDNSTNMVKKEELKKFKAIIDIINIRDNICSDGAIIALELGENTIKLLNNPDYMGNIISHMFKINTIKAKLLSEQHIENVESLLYFMIKLNNYLNLGYSEKSMYNEGHANKLLLGDAMAKVIDGFTAEDLIGFTANLDAFKFLFEVEAQKKLERIEVLMNEVYEIEKMEEESAKTMIAEIQNLGIELDKEEIEQILNRSEKIELADNLMRKLDNKRVRIEDHFYEDRAKELLLKSDLII